MKNALFTSVCKTLRLRLCRMLATMNGKTMVHVFHIGRTGGSAVKYALRRGRPVITGKHIVFTHGHRFGFKDVLPGEKVVFFIRDPIDRFISAFYYRRSKGQPWYYFEWSDAEREAFGTFKTPNELAAALSSGDPDKREKAVKAMKNIAHVNTSYWRWFINEEYFSSRKSDILFIGATSDLNGDFIRLKKILDLPKDIELPLDDEQKNANPPDVDRSLDDGSRINLKSWYSRDFQFLELLKSSDLLKSPGPISSTAANR